jgi:hypothetical protein
MDSASQDVDETMEDWKVWIVSARQQTAWLEGRSSNTRHCFASGELNIVDTRLLSYERGDVYLPDRAQAKEKLQSRTRPKPWHISYRKRERQRKEGKARQCRTSKLKRHEKVSSGGGWW